LPEAAGQFTMRWQPHALRGYSCMTELLSNSAHLHLLLNHVPTVGFGLGLFLFLVAIVARNLDLEKASLCVLFLVATVAIATYVTGNGAESVLRGTAPSAAYPPGVSPATIRAHEDAALYSLLVMEITGFFAWLGLWHWRRLGRLASWNRGLLVILSLVSFASMARTAELGGDIRHAEIHHEDGPLAAVTFDVMGRCTLDMTSGTSYKFEHAADAGGGSNTTTQGKAGDIIVAGECVLRSDGSGGKERGSWYQATSDSAYADGTPIGLAVRDMAKEETGPIQLLGRLTTDMPPSSAPTESADTSSLSTGGSGVARSLGLWVTGQTWVWPTCETLHFVGLCMLFTVVLLVDLRMLGIARILSLEALYQLLPIGMLGFGINLVTGMLFFVGVPGQYIHNVTFFWKIVFVLFGGLNATYFMFVDETWTLKQDEDAPFSSKFAAASAIVVWVAVLYCGHMLPFIGNAF
jgi:hypothetical protein